MTMECSGERTSVGLKALGRLLWEMKAGSRAKKGEDSLAGSEAVPGILAGRG